MVWWWHNGRSGSPPTQAVTYSEWAWSGSTSGLSISQNSRSGWEHVWIDIKGEIRKLMSRLISKSEAFIQTWSSSSSKCLCLITVTTVSSCLITAMTAGEKSVKFKKTDPYLCFLLAAEEKEGTVWCFWLKLQSCQMRKLLHETLMLHRRSEVHWQRMSSRWKLLWGFLGKQMVLTLNNPCYN